MTRGASNGDLGWFLESRFGMFIHFGLYALPARHEWVMSREEIGRASCRERVSSVV